jgi:hypothetical protein
MIQDKKEYQKLYFAKYKEKLLARVKHCCVCDRDIRGYSIYKHWNSKMHIKNLPLKSQISVQGEFPCCVSIDDFVPEF